MLPNVTIPSVPAPQHSTEAVAGGAADDLDGDAFAEALQRAQGRPQHAGSHEPRTGSAKSEDHGRKALQARDGAHQDDAQPPATSATSLDATLDATTKPGCDKQAPQDGTTRCDPAAADATA